MTCQRRSWTIAGDYGGTVPVSKARKYCPGERNDAKDARARDDKNGLPHFSVLRKYFGVFEELFIVGYFACRNHFSDNAVYQALRFIFISFPVLNVK
jgi:hypothetical protein